MLRVSQTDSRQVNLYDINYGTHGYRLCRLEMGPL